MKFLLVLIGVLVFVGCSKSFKEVEPKEEVDSSDLFASEIMQKYDISPNDTSGLKIFGFAENNGNFAILGNKNGHLWVQLLEDNLNGTFKKETNFIVNAKFNDWIEIDLGYGEKKVIEVNYLNWNDKLNSNYLYYIFGTIKSISFSQSILKILLGSFIKIRYLKNKLLITM